MQTNADVPRFRVRIMCWLTVAAIAVLGFSGCNKEPAPPATPSRVFFKTEVVPPQSGRIEIVPAPNQSEGNQPGTHLLLEAVPQEGFEFTSWAGDAGGAGKNVQIVIDSDLSVIAVFSKRTPERPVALPPPAVIAPPPVVAPPPAVAPLPGRLARPMDRNILFNGIPLSAQVIGALEQQYGVAIQDGEY